VSTSLFRLVASVQPSAFVTKTLSSLDFLTETIPGTV
ncbi:MAG: hypothetical protein ACJAUM_001295, partial [Pseudomonadales bacterium]